MELTQVFNQVQNALNINEDIFLFVLIFILLFLVIFAILKRVLFPEKQNHAIALIVSGTISLLSVAYLSQSQLLIIIRSYNLMAFFILFVFPFVLMVVLTHMLMFPPLFRRLMLLGYGVIFLFFIPDVSSFSGGMMALVIMAILGAIIFDGSIHNSIGRGRRH